MIDQAALDELSLQAIAKDFRVLQGFRLAESDASHVFALLNFMDPPRSTYWLDVGCGFGEPARLMHALRPDLSFMLLNNNQLQLDHAPKIFERVQADMHDLPFVNQFFDGVMFLYSLCHADDLCRALAEAARVVRPGGQLFVYDYLRQDGDDQQSWRLLSARFPYKLELEVCFEMTRWQPTNWEVPDGSDAVFRALFNDDALYEQVIGQPLRPYLLKAVRR
jgi:SAM-dependent methyltransferase